MFRLLEERATHYKIPFDWYSLRHAQKHIDKLIRILVLKVIAIRTKQTSLLKFTTCVDINQWYARYKHFLFFSLINSKKRRGKSHSLMFLLTIITHIEQFLTRI